MSGGNQFLRTCKQSALGCRWVGVKFAACNLPPSAYFSHLLPPLGVSPVLAACHVNRRKCLAIAVTHTAEIAEGWRK